MSYAAALEQLNAMAPELFTRPGQPRRKFSLGQVQVLLGALGNPHMRFRSVLLEVGMGGRLDATNVVDPVLSIVTDISLDHMEWLGSTIAQIAREKAGILRPGGTMVTLPQHPEANQVLGEVAEELDVRGVSAAAYMPPIGVRVGQAYPVDVLGTTIELASPLWGAHQHRNTALAVAAAVELNQSHNF